MRKMGRKGQAGPVGNYINWFAMAGIAMIFLAVMAIVLQAFLGTQIDPADNSTTVAGDILNDSLGLFTGLTGQFATVGTIAGTLFLLVVLALVGFWGYGQVRGRM